MNIGSGSNKYVRIQNVQQGETPKKGQIVQRTMGKKLTLSVSSVNPFIVNEKVLVLKYSYSAFLL